MDESEWDLTMRLELARRNSQNQHVKGTVEQPPWEGPVEETIYEGRFAEIIRSPVLIDFVLQTFHQNHFGHRLGLLAAALANVQRHRQITRCPCHRLISTTLPNVEHHGTLQEAARVVHVALRLFHPVQE